jgi:hypothetical protein
MTKTEVFDLLKENRDARGEANWKEMGDRTGGLTSFGIGLTKLRAIAKHVGRDHDLALKLWNERNHDAKIVGLLIDDPKQLTRDQVEKQVDGTGPGMLSHVLSSCDATLPKSPIAFEIAKGWMASKDGGQQGVPPSSCSAVPASRPERRPASLRRGRLRLQVESASSAIAAPGEGESGPITRVTRPAQTGSRWRSRHAVVSG